MSSLVHGARHYIYRHLSLEAVVQNTFQDVTSSIHQSLHAGGAAVRRSVPDWHPLLRHRPGKAVQVGPIKPKFKPPETKRLEVNYDKLLSNFGFKFNLRRYVMATDSAGNSSNTVSAASLAGTMGRFRYIASRAERCRFARNSVWAFNLAPAFPRGALTLCRNSVWAFNPGDIPKSAYSNVLTYHVLTSYHVLTCSPRHLPRLIVLAISSTTLLAHVSRLAWRILATSTIPLNAAGLVRFGRFTAIPLTLQ